MNNTSRSSERKRLLFVVSTGVLDPSAQKRVYDLRPFFHRLGYHTDVLSYRWEWLWKSRMKADMGVRRYRYLLRALNAARAMPTMIRLREQRVRERFSHLANTADAVIVLRTSLDDEWRRILKETAHRIIYDFDDAIWLSDAEGFLEMLTLAHAVVAGNFYLALHASRLNSTVYMIPTGVRLDRYERAARNVPSANGRCIVGWVGSPWTTKYLEMLVEPLSRLGKSIDLTFRVVGTGPATLPHFPNVKVETYPALPYDPVEFVPEFDVGVMPLPDTEWERGKCGAKLLEYMAAGIPSVSSDVGESRRIVQEGTSGFVARDADEWTDKLSCLASDSSLRRRVGLAARERVRTSFSAQVIVSLWHQSLNESSVANR